jgi:hypothetical protein
VSFRRALSRAISVVRTFVVLAGGEVDETVDPPAHPSDPARAEVLEQEL